MKLWAGRFQKEPDTLVNDFNSSIGFDARLYGQDIRGSIAHATMLGKTGIIQPDEAEKIVAGRETIRQQVACFKRHHRLLRTGDYYRLTSPFQEGPYTAWAHVSPDGREALVNLVTGSTHAALPFTNLRLRGLDPALNYRVNGGKVWPGDVLMEAGYPIPLFLGDYQTFQLYLEAAEEP